jgi:hypothetical protein
VDDMGPGTYFLRVILEGGRGDNMRPIVNKDTCNISNNHYENLQENEQPYLHEKQDKILALDESSKIRRVIFCSGKVRYTHIYE